MEHSTRFDEGLSQLRDDGIAIKALEPLLRWFYLRMFARTPERRLFTDLRLTEVTARSGDTSATSGGRSASSRFTGLIAMGKGKTREAHVAEPAEHTPPDDADGSDRHESGPAIDVQAVIRNELDNDRWPSSSTLSLSWGSPRREDHLRDEAALQRQWHYPVRAGTQKFLDTARRQVERAKRIAASLPRRWLTRSPGSRSRCRSTRCPPLLLNRPS